APGRRSPPASLPGRSRRRARAEARRRTCWPPVATATIRRASAFLLPHGSRGRSRRAWRIVHAPELAVPRLAAGALYRGHRPAALGRADLAVGPHEHRPGATAERWGDVCPRGRRKQTHPEEEEERRPEQPSRPSHPPLSVLHGWGRGPCTSPVESGCA